MGVKKRWHPLLRRQLEEVERHDPSRISALEQLLPRVHETYAQADLDRLRIERSLELSMQELLQANHERRAVFGSMPDLFVTVGPTGKIRRIDGGRGMMFAPTGDRIGDPLDEFPDPSTGAKLAGLWREVIEDGLARWIEYWDEEPRPRAWEARIVTMPERECLLVMRNITRRRKAEDAIRQRALHDELTGLPNRTLFQDRLQIALANAKRLDQRIAVIYLDLDRFKSINDTFGHDAGDEVLQEVAYRLSKRMREQDTLARVGGDEFLIIVHPVKSAEALLSIANAIWDQLRDPIVFGGRKHYVTASLGVSVFPEDGDTEEVLIKHADIALYRAKADGRNKMQLYDTELGAATKRRSRLERTLRLAVRNRDFSVMYQPQVSAGERRVVGAEALVRWRRHGAELAPQQWIGLAEECGLMTAIGAQVLERALSDFARSEGDLRLAVNVSALQLVDPRFTRSVEEMLVAANFPAERLELELTESAMLSNLEGSTRALNGLRELGVRIALDDFGTGYSSLSHLKDLPISSLKIDRSFVKLVAHDDRCRAIVRATTAMARELSLEVCAEGVESEALARFVEQEGCQSLQGFYFGRPMSFERLIERATASAVAARAAASKPR